MPTTIRRRDDHREMPWRNGGGMTLEVARSPQDAEDFDWRVSFAHVEDDGPFSTFPGVDRLLVLVEGEQMSLRLHDDERHTLRPFEPFAFAGETDVVCEVPSPTWDLNIMTRRGGASAVVTCLDLTSRPVDVVGPTGGAVVVAILAGRPEVQVDREPVDLRPFDAVILADPSDVTTVSGAGVVAIVTIEAAGSADARS